MRRFAVSNLLVPQSANTSNSGGQNNPNKPSSAANLALLLSNKYVFLQISSIYTAKQDPHEVILIAFFRMISTLN